MKNLPKKTQQLLNATFPAELAQLLGCSLKQLSFYVYKLPKPYKKIVIPKKGLGVRVIHAPLNPVKGLQRKINELLLPLYHPKKSAAAYVKGRSIVYGAQRHAKQRHLLTFDLENFFDHIHFGRVKGLLSATPFNISPKISEILANIICYEDKLPQGGITSPLISNMICWKLDKQLTQLAKETGCSYSRYADDITFSTWKKNFPSKIGSIQNQTITLSQHLTNIVEENGFTINPRKTRYAHPSTRMEVCGLILNKKVNIQRKKIRKIRAMLHDWDIHGYEVAEKNYQSKNDHVKEDANFLSAVEGHLAFYKMVLGEENSIYRKLMRKFHMLTTGDIPTYLLDAVPTFTGGYNYLYGEGQTDWKLLYAAFRHFRSQGLYKGLNLIICPPPPIWDTGESLLRGLVEKYKQIHNIDSKLFFLFDTDVNDATRFAKGNKKNKELYYHHGNNIYTLRTSFEENHCIEHFYSNEVLMTPNEEGRRIYLGYNFNKEGKLKQDPSIFSKNFHQRWADKRRIIDNSVYKIVDGKEVSIARSKNDFASCVLSNRDISPNISFENFKPIFDAIEKALNAYTQ